MKRIHRMDVRRGYDRWSATYDATPNWLVSLDDRFTPSSVRTVPGERVLDAGCGTGRHFEALRDAGAWVVGLDFSLEMLRTARRKFPRAALSCADLERGLPLYPRRFDSVLCALVGEHLSRLRTVFAEFYRVLRPGGRLTFSVINPELAAAGIEANFMAEGTEVRLGAEPTTEQQYLDMMDRAGFADFERREYHGDKTLYAQVPKAARYTGTPLLIVLEAKKLG